MRDVESFADFGQYYLGHFVLSAKDDSEMFYVNGWSGHTKQRIHMTSYKNGELVDDATTYTEAQVWGLVKFGLPDIGMTVIGDELLYLYYKTTRNGGRGFDPGRIVQCTHNGFELKRYGLARIAPKDIMFPKNAWAALRPKYVNLRDAWEDYSTGPVCLAYPLSRMFGVYMSSNPHATLCYRMHEIGDVLGPNSVRLHKRHAEYVDAVRRVFGKDLEISVNEA